MDCIRPFIGIVTSLWPYCVTHADYLCKLQENGDSLEKALNELKNERDDVQQRVDVAEANPNVPMKRKDQVNRWLQSVTAVEGEVVEILRQVDQQTSRRCLGGCCPDNCWSGYMLGRSVVQKIASLDELRKKGGFEEVADKLPSPSVQEEPTNTTVGMESMFEKVWRLLADDEVRIMGLYGYGGVGKTTLLKQINNKFLKTTTSSSSNNLHGFDVVILVVVSKVINIKDIQKEIGSRLGLSSPSPDRTSIFMALAKKNFVLLLDDLWERVDLQSIGIPPPHENSKSKVIFTTRSKTVCGLMDANIKFRVECLPWDEAWTLFQEKVGNETLNSFPRAREVAKVVARECGGLPLALITIGRAMSASNSLQEWNHAKTTLRRAASDFPGMGEEVLPLLKLSYDNLRDDMIKSCFLYCALFPQDHSIDKTKLIDYWIGEGFISSSEFNHIDEARDKGYDVIGNLKGACLLESGYNEETQVKMHDTIRDLALWIAHECGSIKRNKICITKRSDLTAERCWYYNAERIYLIILPPHNGETEVPPLKSDKLITLIYRVNWLHNYVNSRNLWSHREIFHNLLPQNFFEFTPLLRVLDLSHSWLRTFPISITSLLELQYLNLSWTSIRALPEELGKLVKLNFLDLSYMYDLDEIPSGVIGSLLELRVLNLYGCRADLYSDIDELYKLKYLNDLGININTEHNTLTKLLSSSNKNLQICTRHLALLILESSTIVTLEKLHLLSNLETLRLLWFHKTDELMMMNMGIERQQHLGSCFQNLSQIEISNCNVLKDLTWVGYVPNPKTLYVGVCNELEELIVIVVDDLGGTTSKKFMNNVKDIFKSLEAVTLISLPKLKSICRNALAFPCLKTMEVSKCPQLKKLPFDSGSNVNNTLRNIQGGPKWWNELQWEEEEDHDNNNNNNNELLKSKFLPYFVECEGFDI